MSANDKFGLGYGDHRYDGILSYENEVLQSVFLNKESELEKQPLYDRFVTAGGMHAVPPPMTGNYMPSGPDVEIDYSQFTYGPKQTQPSESETQTSEFDTCESNISTETPELVSEPVVNESNVACQPKVWSDAPIIEEYESDSEDEYVSIPTKEQETPSFANQQVKTPRETVKNHFTHSKNPKVDKKELGYGFTARACFVCGSLNHLIRDYDFHEKRMAKQAELNNRTGKIQVNAARASGTKNVSTARHSFNRQAVLTSAAMKVNTVKPIVNKVRPTTVFHKTYSPFSRPFNKTTALRTKFSKQKVNTAKVNAVSAVGGKRETAVKPSAGCNWRPQRHNWHNDYPHRALQNKGIVDSGCSRHMTGNKAYLAEYQDFNGGPVAFGGSKGYITGKGKIKTGKLDFEDVCFVKELQHFNLFSVSQMCDKKNKVLFTDSECLVLSPEFKLPDENQVLLRIPRQNNMYSFNLENIVPSGGLACLIAKATIDESNKWHRRLGHVNFKNLNKLVKGNLVRGLPSKIFQNDHTCVACQKGKQHKASCKAKSVSSISHSLQLLHMDLFGPTSVRSLNHKTYCLVITDDFSRSKGIKREYSNARTPQQNGVAERKNRTLIEAARTMLANSFLPNTFWAEAVNTACYVLNWFERKSDEGFVLCTNLSNRVLGLETSKDAQAAEILKLKDQIKKLKRKCKPSISHHRAWLKSVKRLSMKKRLERKEYVSKQGRKNAKPEPTLDAFDDLDADDRDYIETKDVVKEGRQSNETNKLNKGSGDKGGSTEELVITAVPKIVSTAMPELSTARPNDDAARQEDNAIEHRTPPTTTSIFDDEDITMAQTLIKMKEEKAKEKGVSIKDIEDSSRPARSILTLKPLPTIDPKDKGKSIARDAEIARQLQVDLQAEVEKERKKEEEYTIEERAKFLAETIAAQRKFRAAQRSAEIRSRPPTKSQLRNLMMTYLKNMGGYKHSQLKSKTFAEIQDDAVKDSKEAAGIHKQKVLEEPNSTKVEIKQEGHEESIRKRPSRRLKMKATKKSKRYIRLHGAECIYYRIFRSDGSSRWIKTFSKMVTRFDRLDLEELYNLVMKRFETTTPEGVDLVLWGDLRIMFDANVEDELWQNQERWNLKSLQRGTGTASEDAYTLLRFIPKQIDEYDSHNGGEKDLEVKELASPKQTALGKDISNPLIVDSLLKTIGCINAPCYFYDEWLFSEQKANVSLDPSRLATTLNRLERFIQIGINTLFDEVLENIESKDSYEPALLVTPLSDFNEDECFDPEGEIKEIDTFLDMDISTDIENGYHDS
ncbi:ribonuclease H-like domain-containing protein [Tanacetum coccineum]